MKKLCSLFLVALLVLSTQAVAFATTTENVKTEKPYTESQEFCDAVNQYIIDCGLAYSYCFEKDADGNFTNMFTVSDINIGDPVTIYSETADYVVFGIMGVMNANSKETIGNYEFKNSNLFHHSNPCGYCVYNGDKLYSISDAVTNNIIDVETLAGVIPNTTQVNKQISLQKLCDAVNQYIIDCGLAYSYCFEKGADGKYTNMLTVSDINCGDPVKIYSETADYVVFGIMGVMNANSKETIGNYEFKNSNMFHHSNPCGYCVYNGDKLYSISDAVTNNIIDVETLAGVIPNTTQINMPTTPQPTKPIVKNPKISAEKVKLKAGQTKALKVTNGKVKSWQTKNKKIATVSNGKVVALQKGKVKIVATLTDGKKLTCTVTVTNSPKLNKATVNVKKGKTVSVKLSGKASSINNKYTNTKYAKIISKPKSSTLKIKGLKKGTTTLKVKVNGVKVLKLKVKVK